jgi:hypothetical protein
MRKFTWLLALAIPVTIISCQKDAVHETSEEGALVQAAGNGAPQGGHEYQLNIIGVPKGKSANLSGGEGRRIFVPLYGNAKIMLTEGDYAVLDANGTDGSPAAFSLPNPDPNNDGHTDYSVYARALGTPGGTSWMVTCATSLVGDLAGTKVCSTKGLLSVRSTGQSKFDNVSVELLYIYADIDGDGDLDRVPLFDDRMEDYFWDYTNDGLKLLQLRFYDESTDVTGELIDGAPATN